MTGTKTEAEVMEALRRGSIDVATELLKGLHDARSATERARFNGLLPKAPDARGAVSDVSNLAFQVAQVHAEFLGRLVGVQQQYATRMGDRVARAVGLPTSYDAPVVVVRLRSDGKTLRGRFRVKNSLGRGGKLDGKLDRKGFTEPDKTVVTTDARLRSPSLEPVGWMLESGDVAMVEIVVDANVFSVGVPYRGRYTVTVENEPVLELELDVLRDRNAPWKP